MTHIQAQQCHLTLLVNVQGADNKPLPLATILIDSLDKALLTGNKGISAAKDICAGTHRLKISYAGYNPVNKEISLRADTGITVVLFKNINSLKEVTVTAVRKKSDEIATLASSDIKGLELLQTRGNTLGESLKSIPGLNSLQTGPSVSKPVLHGLQGNRLLIMNNGIRQEGQQWGSEHAPEIDPFIASKITVIKGAASVRYGSDAIVGVIMLEPKTLAPVKKLDGELNLVASTNGRLGVASALLEGKFDKKLEGLSWRVQGTLKEGGNFRTSRYYLANTGLREHDFSLTTAYKKDHYGVELYYSEFHNKVGIFEGSHVGNANDLFAAFKRDIPITASYFTYKIDRTYQNINHDLFKATAYYQFKNNSKLQVIYASQKNIREEFDIDLPYTTDPAILAAPQISFRINTQTLDLVYDLPDKNNFSGSVGVNGSTQGNVFRGIRYLVPNFRNYTGGVFAIERYSKNKWVAEAGLRYDYRWLRVYRLNNTTLQAYHNTSDYNNVSGTMGATYRVSNRWSANANLGTAWRAPSINELYIDGIHLSAASYEKGDSSLQSERSYNFTLSTKYEGEKLAAEVVLYNNVINNFIYAKPALKPVQLISGTYPLFNYTQANVNLKGIDLDLQYKFSNAISITSKTSLLRAWNKTINDYLIFMPADKFDNSIRYSFGKIGNLKDAWINLQNVSILRQTRVPPNSDYVAPPKGYSLFNFSVGCITHVAKKELNIIFGIDNLTNVSYRDYLNRFRYYADDLGLSAVIRTKLSF